MPAAATGAINGLLPPETCPRHHAGALRRMGHHRDLLEAEDLPLHPRYEMIHDAQAGIARYLTFCNESQPHRALDGHTPDRVY